MRAANQGWTQDPGGALERAEKLAQKAIALDDLSSNAHALLGDVAVQFGDYDRALGELKRAIDLNGSDAESYGHLVTVLLFEGDISGAIAGGELVTQFRPEIPDGAAFDLGVAYILADRGADAVRILEHAVDRNPGHLYMNVMLAAAYGAVGRQQDAERQADRVHQRFPTFSRDRFGSALRDPSLRAKLDRALEKAGL
jgi:adenylate cyclase